MITFYQLFIMTKKEDHNKNSRKQSPHRNKRLHHNSHQHHHAVKRPNSIVFPPDPNETGPQTVNRIFESFGLTDQFPSNCQKFVKELLERDPCDDPKLQDFTAHPYITIDNDNSMDLDQAMWISRSEQRIRVSYALADGAYFCPALSPLFQYALQRGGSSFYLPSKCIPMLPRTLSEDCMSLNANVTRRALVFDHFLDAATGSVVKTTYTWAKIQSRWKGTYREVSEYYDAIDAGQDHFLAHTAYQETLDLLRKVGLLRRQLATERDVVDYNRDGRSNVAMNDQQQLIFSIGHTRYSSELYNEQISLLCNSEGAKILDLMDVAEEADQRDIVHPIFRTQSGPHPEQVEILAAVIDNTLGSHGLDVTKWGWDREKTPIATYLSRLREQVALQLDSSPQQRKWASVLRVIERQAMITNVAASFTATPEDGHFSLKMSHYARFSSPMRELVGCFTHKELWEGHTGSFSSQHLTSASDIALRDNVVRAARRAKAMQKKLSAAMFLHMLNVTFYRQLQVKLPKRTVYKGILMGMDFSEKRNKSRRCYVQLEEPAIEIKVYGEDLDYHWGCRYGPVGATFGHRGTSVSISPKKGSFAEDADDEVPPTFKAGQHVTIRVSDYAQFYGQSSRSRWIFIMDVDHEKEEVEGLSAASEDRGKAKGAGSLLRNSVVDRDLMQDMLEDEDGEERETSS